MLNFFAIVFFRFRMLLKDDLSAIGLVTYFLSLNIFTILGSYKYLFQHSHLSDVPIAYALLIMIATGLFTRFVLLQGFFTGNMFKEFRENLIAKTKKGRWLTMIYAVLSFVLMLAVV
ncbi:MAG TPA: hypothetical protein VMT76_16215 [Puia sp.]|nr:hypothetical protein [Puia sp.]